MKKPIILGLLGLLLIGGGGVAYWLWPAEEMPIDPLGLKKAAHFEAVLQRAQRGDLRAAHEVGIL